MNVQRYDENRIGALAVAFRGSKNFWMTTAIGAATVYTVMFAAALRGTNVEIALATVMAGCTAISAFIEAKRAGRHKTD